MWHSEADKYWKQKQQGKRRQRQLRLFKLGILTGLCVAILIAAFVFSQKSQVATVTAVKGEFEANGENMPGLVVLNECKQACRLQVIDECNNKCRFALSEHPRPTVFRSCQAPCVAVGQAMCGISSDTKKFVRDNCKLSGKSMCFRRCKEYANVQPKPRALQVCTQGCESIFPYACDHGSKCVVRNTL